MSEPAWPARAFEPQSERSVEVERIDGRLPEALRGSFFRVGPGALDVGGQPNLHWFDGDGLVCAFHLADGKARFQCRFVQTPWRTEEQAAGRPLYSAFATSAPALGNRLQRPKNPANTNIVPFAGQLLALYEAGRPFALDPATLQTRGEEGFDGTLPLWAPFSAHPHRDPASGALVSVGLGVRLGRRGPYPVAETWEVSPAGRARRGRTLRLRHPDVIHSTGLTPSRVVVLAGPYGLDATRLPGLLLGQHGIFDCARWRPRDPLVAHLAPRAGGAEREYELPTGFVIHVVNAFDDGEDVVVDAVVHPDPGLVESIRLPLREPTSAAGRLVRTRLRADGRAEQEPLSEVGMEFPTVRPDLDGRRHRYVYAGRFERGGAARPTGALLKVDALERRTREHDLGPGCLFGEPVFVPRPGGSAEDDGWVLSLGYDGRDHHAFLAVLRADAWDEVARLHLPFHLPVGLHASFAPAQGGTAPT